MPAGLRVANHVDPGTWGRIVVSQGELRFVAQTRPVMDVVIRSGCAQAIPPDIEYDIQPLGQVRFSIDYLSIPGHSPDNTTVASARTAPTDVAPLLEPSEEGGDPVCWAHLLCPECGTFLDEGPHDHGEFDEGT
jgi:tellurite resistance-related uncharacterized protein